MKDEGCVKSLHRIGNIYAMSWRMCRSLPDIQEKKAFHVERKAWEKSLRWQTQKMGINSYIET